MEKPKTMAAEGSVTEALTPIVPAPPREERIRRLAALAQGEAAAQFVPYRGGYRQVPVIEAPQALLLYRVENGRLIADLEEHARDQGRDIRSLSDRQESAEVQRLLHAFLIAKAKDPKGPIFQELQRLAQQVEPLLITADGVLVNGNRRLAAMRELLHRDSERYAGFDQIAVAVLPEDADLADMESVEAALQMAPDTKLAYGWINRRLKMRRQRDELGLPPDAITAAYRLDDPSQLQRELAELALVDDYLVNFAGRPGRYSLVADAELLFAGLAERLAALPEDHSKLWRLAGFAMIHGRKAVQGPLDRHFPFAKPVPNHLPAWALRAFAEERGLTAFRGEEDAQAIAPGVQQDLAVILADPARSDALAVELFALMERLRVEFQDPTTPERALMLLGKLRYTLARLNPERMSETQKRRVRSDAAAIQAQMTVLLGPAEQAPSAAKRGVAGRLGRLFGRH